MKKDMAAICNECGRSVKEGSGRFVNRIPDCNTQEERKEMGKPYPEGDFVCAECDGVIECESCGTSYTEEEFEKLELTGHNGFNGLFIAVRRDET